MTRWSYARILRPTWDDAYRLARRLLDRFDVPRKQAIKTLSRGKRAALGCICGLAARTPITMFDEPHLGMDVPTRYAFYDELLSDYMAHPRTIILSTHHIDEVASLFAACSSSTGGGSSSTTTPTTCVNVRGAEVVGPTADVDRLVAGLTVLNERTLGGTTSAVTYGGMSDEQRREAARRGLELKPIPLQDLFVHLTEEAA